MKATLNKSSKIEASITKKTKAIIYIDYGGFPIDFQKIRKIAKNNNYT